MSGKKLFQVVWISERVNGTVINPTFVKAKNISGACKQVEAKDTCVAVLSVKMLTGPFNTDKDVETLEEYDAL